MVRSSFKMKKLLSKCMQKSDTLKLFFQCGGVLIITYNKWQPGDKEWFRHKLKHVQQYLRLSLSLHIVILVVDLFFYMFSHYHIFYCRSFAFKIQLNLGPSFDGGIFFLSIVWQCPHTLNQRTTWDLFVRSVDDSSLMLYGHPAHLTLQNQPVSPLCLLLLSLSPNVACGGQWRKWISVSQIIGTNLGWSFKMALAYQKTEQALVVHILFTKRWLFD